MQIVFLSFGTPKQSLSRFSFLFQITVLKCIVQYTDVTATVNVKPLRRSGFFNFRPQKTQKDEKHGWTFANENTFNHQSTQGFVHCTFRTKRFYRLIKVFSCNQLQRRNEIPT